MKPRVFWGVQLAWRNEQVSLIGDGGPLDFGEVFFSKLETNKT